MVIIQHVSQMTNCSHTQVLIIYSQALIPTRHVHWSFGATDWTHESPSHCRITRIGLVASRIPPRWPALTLQPFTQLSKYRSLFTLNDFVSCGVSLFEIFNLMPHSYKLQGGWRCVRSLQRLLKTSNIVVVFVTFSSEKKPELCARFTTRPWSPVVQKWTQEIAFSESEPYVMRGTSAAWCCSSALLYVQSLLLGESEAERAWEKQRR